MTNQMSALVTKYLEDKQTVWAPSTRSSERHRLSSVVHALDGNAKTLWGALQHLRPYARVTSWVRVTDFYQWCLDEGHLTGLNIYAAFRKKNPQLFRNAYTPTKPSITYEEAKARISTISNEAVRTYALRLLEGGLRFHEAPLVENGRVCGKGRKTREVFVQGVAPVAYHQVRRALAKVGLKPHMLRKLFLTRLTQLGANPFELCQVAGWSSVQTAQSYISNNNGRIQRLVSEAQGNEAK
jgi:integrase